MNPISSSELMREGVSGQININEQVASGEHRQVIF